MDIGSRIEVMADVSRNCVKLSFAGMISSSDIERYESEIARALSSLRPGFSLLTDFTELTSMEMGCVPAMERTMDLMRSKGVKLVVRVIPDQAKDIGMNIMSLFHYPHGLKIVTTETRDEAAKIIGEP
jgi:hypothetical protein